MCDSTWERDQPDTTLRCMPTANPPIDCRPSSGLRYRQQGKCVFRLSFHDKEEVGRFLEWTFETFKAAIESDGREHAIAMLPQYIPPVVADYKGGGATMRCSTCAVLADMHKARGKDLAWSPFIDNLACGVYRRQKKAMCNARSHDAMRQHVAQMHSNDFWRGGKIRANVQRRTLSRYQKIVDEDKGLWERLANSDLQFDADELLVFDAEDFARPDVDVSSYLPSIASLVDIPLEEFGSLM